MIKRLYIKNLAIIKELEVSFGSGLNVITGETGSGKSILIGAIGLLLGGRASGDIIRTGEDAAVVEGEWSSGGNTLLVRRNLRTNGTSRSFLNDEPIKLADLAGSTAALVDLHGQHEHQSLLRVSTHIDFLDAFAGLLPERGVLSHTYSRLMELNTQLAEFTHRIEQDKELYELHQFQLQELEAAAPAPQEAHELTQEHERLSQAEALHEVLNNIEVRLQNDEPSVAGDLGGLLRQLERFVHLSPALALLGERFASVKVEVEDLAYEAGRYGATVHPDPQRLADIDERLGQLETIKRKYGGSLEAAREKMKQLQALVEGYVASDERWAQLREEQQRQQAAYSAQCQALSSQRRAACINLQADIVATLARLDMPGTRFEVRVSNELSATGACHIGDQTYRSDERGYDRVEFYISPNPGEELRPLVKIASGGEISRIMLGIKTVLTAYDPVDCLIFDEIDNGISGATAETVGAALEELARSRQVICITHLPQIAARGAYHLIVTKEIHQGRTLSRIRVLSDEERREEIARLLSGAQITQASMDQAQELLSPFHGSPDHPRRSTPIHG